MAITDKTLWVGRIGEEGPSWYVEWGRVGVWRKGVWCVEFHVPYVRWKRWASEVFLAADTVLRLNWRRKEFAIQVVGFGLAVSLDPDAYKRYRNTGVCWHSVPLNRTCAECKKEAGPTDSEGES